MELMQIDGMGIFRSGLLGGYAELGHAFSTRVGGVSSGTHASLNLSEGTGDEHWKVVKNRRRLLNGIGASLDRLAIPRQVCGSMVIPVDEWTEGAVTAKRADGLVTDRRGVPTMTLSADCVLVLIYDPVQRALANVHSSRLGALGEISARAVERMTAEYGSRPADLAAAIGPSIGPCCYELGEDAAGEWRARHGERFLQRRGARTILDLWGATRAQLEGAGVGPERIDAANVCTRCSPDLLFSYRRDGEKTGRFGAVAWLK